MPDRREGLSVRFSSACSTKEIFGEIRDLLATENPTCLRHPHGFYVALLARNSDEEWRLHVWPKGRRRITGMPAFIHTHNCRVESRVLIGTLTNVTYEAVDVSIGGAPLYEVGYSADRYLSNTTNRLERLDRRVDMRVHQSLEVNAGMTYCVERHEFHEVVVPNEQMTATLVRMTARRPGPVFVAGVDGFPALIDFKRSTVSSGDLLASIDPVQFSSSSP